MIRSRLLLSIVTSFLIGSLFLYSAYTKLFPVETFEYTLVEYLGMQWQVAAVFARALVGAEGGLGILLVLNFWGNKRWVLWLSVVTLLLFSGYIGYLWVRFGNHVNCGCFGDAISMKPITALVKNGLLLLLTFYLLKFYSLRLFN
ncbi:MAG: hypothetical protein EBZ77_14440, partial [Chitinophagia bacterium]|nr:hypothetical protein [Chitinophagia bacterium]